MNQNTQGIQCKKPENTKGKKAGRERVRGNSQLRETRCGRGVLQLALSLLLGGSGAHEPVGGIPRVRGGE